MGDTPVTKQRRVWFFFPTCAMCECKPIWLILGEIRRVRGRGNPPDPGPGESAGWRGAGIRRTVWRVRDFGGESAGSCGPGISRVTRDVQDFGARGSVGGCGSGCPPSMKGRGKTGQQHLFGEWGHKGGELVGHIWASKVVTGAGRKAGGPYLGHQSGHKLGGGGGGKVDGLCLGQQKHCRRGGSKLMAACAVMVLAKPGGVKVDGGRCSDSVGKGHRGVKVDGTGGLDAAAQPGWGSKLMGIALATTSGDRTGGHS